MKKRLNPSQLIGLLCLLCCTIFVTGNILPAKNTATPPPPIICPDDTGQQFYSKNMQRLAGNLDANDRLVELAEHSCFTALTTLSDGEHAYDTLTFSPSVTTRYTFLLATDFDAVFGLSYGEFDENNPCWDGMGESTNSYSLPLPTIRTWAPYEPLISADSSY